MTALMSRRSVLSGSLATVCVAGLGACGRYGDSYETILAEQVRPIGATPEIKDLIRYATLAANSHNSQPWLFHADEASVAILPDFGRRTPVVDPDDHHLFASLGCATENLSIAARGTGRSGEVVFDGTAEGGARVDLAAASPEASPLLAAIPARSCTRATYDGKAVPSDVIDRMSAAARIDGVETLVVLDEKGRNDLLDLVIAGNSRQMTDDAYITELKSWLRFNAGAAAAARDGLYSAASGNPNLPGWLGPIMFDLTVTKDGENEKTAEQIRSSSGIVAFVADANDKAGWLAAGRAFQRFALQATVEGVKYAFVNQAVEVPEVRTQLATQLGIGERRPNLLVRFGYGPDMPRSLRRSVEEVLVPPGGKKA
jgi:nitroreductase